jgi:hypothetical protein
MLIGCTDTIHFVDEANTRHVITVSLSPDGLALRFYTLNRVEDYDTAIQYTQGTLYFGSKVDMPGCINDIDLITLPFR